MSYKRGRRYLPKHKINKVGTVGKYIAL